MERKKLSHTFYSNLPFFQLSILNGRINTWFAIYKCDFGKNTELRNGAKAIYEDLKTRFPGSKRRKNNGKNDGVGKENDKRDD